MPGVEDTSAYTRHRESYAACDFCGAPTKGRIYDMEPCLVRCGACNRVIKTLEPQELNKP